MKPLFLAPYPPYPPRGGGQQRMYQLLRQTAARHESWLLTLSASPESDAALEPLRELCHVITVPQPRHTPARRLRALVASSLPDMALRGQSRAFRAALDDLLRSVQPDVIQAESIEMAQYGARAQFGPLWIYDAFNAEFLLQRRAFETDLRHPRKLPVAIYSLIQWYRLRRYEQRLSRRFHGALAVSHDDARILRALDPALSVSVVPNGVDTAHFRRGARQLTAESPYALFTGTLDFRANVDAVTWCARDVWPLVQQSQPGLRLVVVGRNPVPAVRALAALPYVEIVGEVDDVRPWFDGAAAYVVPMRIGGGVRLKVLEALAMTQAVVATSLAVEGIDGLRPGIHALLADQPDTFAATIARVVSDQALAAQLGAAGRSLVVDHYDWQAIAPRMWAAWDELRAAQSRQA